MNNNINISKNTIDTYKNNTEILRGLKVRMESGSCSVYDFALYNKLVSTKNDIKKLTLKTM